MATGIVGHGVGSGSASCIACLSLYGSGLHGLGYSGYSQGLRGLGPRTFGCLLVSTPCNIGPKVYYIYIIAIPNSEPKI